MRSRIVAGAVVMLLAGALVSPARAITNGQVDDGRHPFVGALLHDLSDGSGVYPTCTGTLISQTVFLTAAHCHFADRVSVSFDEKIVPGTKGLWGSMYSHPKYVSATEYDIAVVVLDKPVRNITPARLAPLGFLDSQTLTSSTKFTSVGYGGQEPTNEPGPGGPVIAFEDVREYSVGSFKGITQGALHIWQKASRGDGGTCYGDSGGPQFWGAGSTETNVVVSATVTGDGLCKSTNVTARMDTQAAHSFLDSYL